MSRKLKPDGWDTWSKTRQDNYKAKIKSPEKLPDGHVCKSMGAVIQSEESKSLHERIKERNLDVEAILEVQKPILLKLAPEKGMGTLNQSNEIKKILKLKCELKKEGLDLKKSKLVFLKSNLNSVAFKFENGDVVIPSNIAEEYAKKKWLNLLKEDTIFKESTYKHSGRTNLAKNSSESDLKKLASDLYEENDNGFIFGFDCDSLLDKEGKDTGFYIIRNENGRSIE